MRRIVLSFVCLLFPFMVMGQQSDNRPFWAVDGYTMELDNSVIMEIHADGNSYNEAYNKATNLIQEVQSRRTGLHSTIVRDGNSFSVSSYDELTVKSNPAKARYDEYLPSGLYRVYLLVQIANHPDKKVEPVSYTDIYPFSARVFVPGMAQIHKGSTTKGLVFIASEIIAVGGVVAFEGLRSSNKSKINSTHNAKDRQNYIDNANNMENLRNGFIAGAVAIYVWNVIDGIAAKGKKHIQVGNLSMNINPYTSFDETGVMLTMNF